MRFDDDVAADCQRKRNHKPNPDKCVGYSIPPPSPPLSGSNAAGKGSDDRQLTRRSKWLVLNPAKVQSRRSEWPVLDLDHTLSRGSKWPVLAAPAADTCLLSPGQCPVRAQSADELTNRCPPKPGFSDEGGGGQPAPVKCGHPF